MLLTFIFPPGLTFIFNEENLEISIAFVFTKPNDLICAALVFYKKPLAGVAFGLMIIFHFIHQKVSLAFITYYKNA